MRTFTSYFIVPVFVFFTTNLCSQDTIRVPQDHPTIQAAFDASVTNTVILVSPGIYVENLVWPKTKYGIKLIGALGRDSTIIDGNQVKRVIEKENFLADPNSIIQGFTIRNGNSNESGGGIHISKNSTTLKDLIIANNKCGQYSSGGGVHLASYSGTIDNCIFRDNEVYSFQSSKGGGLYINTNGNIQILNSAFESNHSGGQSTNSGYGGGLYISASPTREIIIHNCRFTGNTTGDNTWSRGAGAFLGGGIVTIDSCTIGGNSCSTATHSEGGGIYSEASNFTLTNSQINSNKADSASAIMLNADEASVNVIMNCTFSGNQRQNLFQRTAIEMGAPASTLEMRNCMITRNEAVAIGVTNSSFPKSTLFLNHCTVAYNFGGGIDAKNTNVTIQNSILQNALGDIKLTGTSTAKVNSSLVYGGYPGGGNIEGDALLDGFFTYVPKVGSPCLGSANPAMAEPFDVYGNPRPNPSYTPPDMGAVEIKQLLSYVNIRFFYDLNKNGLRESDERYTEIGAVKVQDSISYSNFRKEGLRIYVDTGLVSVAFDSVFLAEWKGTGQTEHQFHVDTSAASWDIEFGITPESDEIIARTFINVEPFRCGEEVTLSLVAINEFAPIQDAILWLQVDDRISTFSFDAVPDTVVSTHKVGWLIDELYPTESVSYAGYIDAPTIAGGAQIGDHYLFKSWIENATESSVFQYNAELRCSFDPNDKLVNPNRADSLALIDEPLFYTIRFQNTGNDYARHVSVTDTLDANLDISTFRLIHTSHPDHIEVVLEENGAMRFDFKNIFLLDSTTNLAESNGHISYTIKAFPGVELRTQVNNKADIYFDFNPPVVTNTASSILVKDFTVSNHDPGKAKEILVFPNPTSGIIYFSKEVEFARIHNLEGKLLLTGKNVHQLDLNNLPQGIFMLSLITKGKYEVHSITLSKN